MFFLVCVFVVVVFQNIIKKVSGQKFVYKFVSQLDPSLPEGVPNGEDSQRRENADPTGQSKGIGGVASTCPSKGLPQVHFDFLCLLFCVFLPNEDVTILTIVSIDWFLCWSAALVSQHPPEKLQKRLHEVRPLLHLHHPITAGLAQRTANQNRAAAATRRSAQGGAHAQRGETGSHD